MQQVEGYGWQFSSDGWTSQLCDESTGSKRSAHTGLLIPLEEGRWPSWFVSLSVFICLPLDFRDADMSLEGKNYFRNQDSMSNMYQMTRKIVQKSEKC